MGVPKLKPKISVVDYLEGEKTSDVRHEYLNGDIYAMSGASKRHNRIAFKLARLVADRTDEMDCEPFMNDVKVYVKTLNRFYYPDLIVACGDDDEDEYYVNRPTIIVEVSSPSTASTDRREKLFAYQEIESLQEYLMIEQDTEHAELYRRRDDGLWSWITFEPGEDLELESIKFKTPLSELYT